MIQSGTRPGVAVRAPKGSGNLIRQIQFVGRGLCALQRPPAGHRAGTGGGKGRGRVRPGPPASPTGQQSGWLWGKEKFLQSPGPVHPVHRDPQPQSLLRDPQPQSLLKGRDGRGRESEAGGIWGRLRGLGRCVGTHMHTHAPVWTTHLCTRVSQGTHHTQHAHMCTSVSAVCAYTQPYARS